MTFSFTTGAWPGWQPVSDSDIAAGAVMVIQFWAITFPMAFLLALVA
jgi:hypothetical protein